MRVQASAEPFVSSLPGGAGGLQIDLRVAHARMARRAC